MRIMDDHRHAETIHILALRIAIEKKYVILKKGVL
jgi:hypothetical protein